MDSPNARAITFARRRSFAALVAFGLLSGAAIAPVIMSLSPQSAGAAALAGPGTVSARAAGAGAPVGPGTKSSSGAARSAVVAAAPDGLFPFTTVTGKVYMSEDAVGTNDPAGGSVFVQKSDSSATVQAAYLLAAGVPDYAMQNGDVTLNGTSLSFASTDSVQGNFGVNSVWADVTSIVKPVVDAAAPGNVGFTAAEPTNTESVDGEILAVIMNDPTLPTNNTVSFLFGALDTTGDNFSIGLASPLNLSDPNLALTMSLGDSYGYTGPPATGQYSTITVNGTLMTSSAGGNDDSVCKNDNPQDFENCGNGDLITVGGIGDSTANPADPTATDSTCAAPGPPRCDDELYNLLPFVQNGDTSIQVNTTNPSTNDNIFFAGFQLNSAAAVIGEGAVLTPVSGSNPMNSPYTFTTKVQDSNGSPIANQPVTFTVLSGPNAGKTSAATTDSNGVATFSYTSSTTGTDTVQVSFTGPSNTNLTSNQASVTWNTTGAQPTSLTTSFSGGGVPSGTMITVPSGTPVTDSSTLTGTNAATATGSVTYTVFSDNGCHNAVASGGTKTLAGGAVPNSDPVTLNAAGTYYWQASYNGDSLNSGSQSVCGSEIETVPPPTNGPPTANNQNVSTNQNTAVSVTLTGSDPNGDPLTYTVVGIPAHGTLSGTAPNLTYTPTSGYSGPDSFTFKANDGKVDSNTATVSLTVVPVAASHPPVADSQCVSTPKNTAVPIMLTGSDPDGNPLTYSIVTGPAHGTLSGTAPNLTYTPASGYKGADSFTFKVNDGKADSNIAQVSITVTKAGSALHCDSKGKHGHGKCKWWHVGRHHHQLKVRNHGHGWVAVTVSVDGHQLHLGNVKNGQTKSYNIGAYMKHNGHDVVVIDAVGSTPDSDISFGI